MVDKDDRSGQKSTDRRTHALNDLRAVEETAKELAEALAQYDKTASALNDVAEMIKAARERVEHVGSVHREEGEDSTSGE